MYGCAGKYGTFGRRAKHHNLKFSVYQFDLAHKPNAKNGLDSSCDIRHIVSPSTPEETRVSRACELELRKRDRAVSSLGVGEKALVFLDSPPCKRMGQLNKEVCGMIPGGAKKELNRRGRRSKKRAELLASIEDGSCREHSEWWMKTMNQALVEMGIYEEELAVIKAGLELPFRLQRCFNGAERDAPRAPAFLETSEGAYQMLMRNGDLDDRYRLVIVGGNRWFYVSPEALPTLDLLSLYATRCKATGKHKREGKATSKRKRSGRVTPDSDLAARLEVPVLDAILLAVLLDVVAAKLIVARARELLEERKLAGNRGRPYAADPSLEATAAATAVCPPRAIDYEAIRERALEAAREKRLRHLLL